MARIPIIKMGSNLIATVQEDLTDDDALAFQEDLNRQLERIEASGVLLDLTQVQLIDSFLGRLISEIALGARLLGAETVMVGIQPAVAMTLVELGFDLPGIRTALTPERALKMLDGASG